jgi:hypothetical protein
VILALRTGLAAALVAGVFAVAGCSSPSRCPPGAPRPAIVPRVMFIPIVHGKPAVLRKDGHVPSYRVRSGEYLVIRVAVVVPKHVKITALWFGVSTGTWGTGPQGHPTGMNPILAHYAQPLPAGSHTFGLRWRIPRLRASASRMLTFAWSSSQPSASVTGPFAQLVVN